MDPINSVARLFNLLRMQPAQKTPRARKSKSAFERSDTRRELTLAELERHVIACLNANPLKDMDARELVMQSILAWHFGGEILADPDFENLLEKMQHLIEQNADLSRYYDGLVQSMQKKRV